MQLRLPPLSQTALRCQATGRARTIRRLNRAIGPQLGKKKNQGRQQKRTGALVCGGWGGRAPDQLTCSCAVYRGPRCKL